MKFCSAAEELKVEAANIEKKNEIKDIINVANGATEKVINCCKTSHTSAKDILQILSEVHKTIEDAKEELSSLDDSVSNEVNVLFDAVNKIKGTAEKELKEELFTQLQDKLKSLTEEINVINTNIVDIETINNKNNVDDNIKKTETVKISAKKIKTLLEDISKQLTPLTESNKKVSDAIPAITENLKKLEESSATLQNGKEVRIKELNKTVTEKLDTCLKELKKIHDLFKQAQADVTEADNNYENVAQSAEALENKLKDSKQKEEGVKSVEKNEAQLSTEKKTKDQDKDSKVELKKEKETEETEEIIHQMSDTATENNQEKHLVETVVTNESSYFVLSTFVYIYFYLFIFGFSF